MEKQPIIQRLTSEKQTIEDLAEMIIETVADGGSVSFMHPLEKEEAIKFWSNSLASADREERIVIGAYLDEKLVGTVTLLLDFPPNQPHRCEIAKMITRPSFRKKGIAKKLLQYAEEIARGKGKWLVCLDTAADGGAAGLYEKMGYIRAGVIPDFALKPYGGLTPTIVYYKHLNPKIQEMIE